MYSVGNAATENADRMNHTHPVAFSDTFSAALNHPHNREFHGQYIWPSKNLRVINQMSEFVFQFRLTLKNTQYRSLQRRGTRE